MPQVKPKIVIYFAWKDFRLTDNPALYNALEFARENQLDFLPVYTLDNGWVETDRYNIGYPRRFALSRILSNFAVKFERFEVVVSEPEKLVEELILKYEVFLFINDDVEPYAIKRHQNLQKLLQPQGVNPHFFRFKNELSVPADIRTTTGGVYSVFTPFKRAVMDHFLNSQVLEVVDPNAVKYFQGKLEVSAQTLPATEAEIFAKIDQPGILKFGSDYTLNLEEIFERPDLSYWVFDENEALRQFDDFNKNKLSNYKDNRNNLTLEAAGHYTSRMSLSLAWGLVSVRSLKNKILEYHQSPDQNPGVESYISELIWREFYRYILIHFPQVLDLEFQSKFRGFQWQQDTEALHRFEAWVKGLTGYKLVDAAMNQVAAEAWMHNRNRMVVASVMSKNLGLDWRWGQEYFRMALIDLDEASNNGGWQWSASVGVDPKPIRIFNPYLQAENYDPEGKYQAKWLPTEYNQTPIVEHSQARYVARERYQLSSNKGKSRL